MPTPALSAVSPPDIGAILTSLGIFSLAIAATVGGIYRGIKEVKKGGEDTGKEVGASIIMDRGSIVRLTDATDRLANLHGEICNMLRSINHSAERLTEALEDSRGTTRSQTEEQHRLRAAVVDLVEMMRRMRT